MCFSPPSSVLFLVSGKVRLSFLFSLVEAKVDGFRWVSWLWMVVEWLAGDVLHVFLLHASMW